MKYRLRDDRENLRGRHMIARVENRDYRVTVITHIRDGRWLVQGHKLPKSCQRFLFRRTTVYESCLRPAPIQKSGRSPIERLVDKACGLE